MEIVRLTMRIKQILLATLLTLFPLLSSFATDYYIATSDLNVRTGAGTGYSVSFTLQKDDEVELLSKENNWYKIKYLGKTGYAYSKYLKFSRTISDTKSNPPQQIVNTLLIGAYVSLAIFLGFIIYGKIRNIYGKIQDKHLLESVTHEGRGEKSERDLILKLLKYGIPEQNIFHDLFVEKSKGEFSQADLVIVTEVGIIVFEVKDYSGWIFGSGNQSQWTKVLAYGKQKYFFYNPIKQNNTHIAELRRQLYQFENIPFFSIVVFYGDCELKNINFVPNGTFIVKSKRVLEVVRNILRDNKPFLYPNENEVLRILREAVTNGGIIENQIQHSKNIIDMLGTHRVFD